MSFDVISLDQLESMVRNYVSEKKQAKPGFSIRNQAARWGIAHSTLQKVVSGDRQLGLKTARKLAAVFNTRIEDAKHPRRQPEDRWKFKLLDAHSSEQVSWINLAILELLKLDDFTPSAKWVAKRMGLDVDVTEFILQKMEREKMLKREGDEWTDLLEDSVVALSNFITTEQVRESIVDLLRVSISSVENVPYERREHSFNLIPVTQKQIPRLRRRLSELRLEFTQSVQNASGPKDQVYAFQLGFFPVTVQEPK